MIDKVIFSVIQCSVRGQKRLRNKKGNTMIRYRIGVIVLVVASLVPAMMACNPSDSSSPVVTQVAQISAPSTVVVTVPVGTHEAVRLVSEPFPLAIDYDVALTEAFRLSKSAYSAKETRFSTLWDQSYGHGKQSLSARLFKYPGGAYSDDVVMDMNKMGYRPATLRELLAFAAAFSTDNCHKPVVALGSEFSSEISTSVTPWLSLGEDGRFVGLLGRSGVGTSDLRYLAVFKN